MSSGLTYSPLRYSLGLPTRGLGSHKKQITSFPNLGRSINLLSLHRNGLAASTWGCKQRVPPIKCAMEATFGYFSNDSTAIFSRIKERDPYKRLGISKQASEDEIQAAMDATFGDSSNDATAIFPRIEERDPYKRLGISKQASEDEIQAARTFLIQTYGGHKPSVDAIESAHDKIIMQKFHERKNPKINVKKKVREVTQSRYVQAVINRFRTPSMDFIIKTSAAFIILGVLTVLFPTEEGPTLQVGISLFVTLYFLYDRLKSKLWALVYGAGSFVLSWLIGTFLMASVIPPILKGPRSLEVTTSLISYIILWASSTYLR